MASNGVTLEEIVDTAVTRAMSRGVTEIRDELEQLRLNLPPQLGSVKDAARCLGVSTRMVWRMIADGKVHASRVGSKPVVDLARLHEVATRIAPTTKRKASR